jgi:hypothetical protein
MLMVNYFNVQTIQACLDDYLIRTGKTKIGEIEANHELERAGLMADDTEHPGEPLRIFLEQLRDTNSLPKNITLINSAWAIRHSKTNAKSLLIFNEYA